SISVRRRTWRCAWAWISGLPMGRLMRITPLVSSSISRLAPSAPQGGPSPRPSHGRTLSCSGVAPQYPPPTGPLSESCMKSLMVLMLLSGASLSGVLAEEVRSAGGEEVLETPGGHPIAVLLPGAVRRTLEEKDGYVRIVVDGWVRAGAPSVQGAIPPPTFPPPIQPPAAPDPSPAAPEVSGRITLRLASGEVRYGAGARIVLLGK